MSRSYAILPALVMALLLSIVSCERILAPGNTVPKRAKFEFDAFGGYAHVKCRDSSKYEGELIGSRNDSIVLLNAQAVILARNSIVRSDVIMYNPNDYGWGYLSIVATISNGAFLIFTGPLWLISTTAAVANEGVINYKAYPAVEKDSKGHPVAVGEEEAWKMILKFSRFPQGIPVQIPLTDLKGRPKK